MDKNKNYYSILGINNQSTEKEIKKAYYSKAKILHPDKKNESDELLFSEITEAYDILTDSEIRKEYDMKSKWGNNYNEYYDLFDIDFGFSYENEKERLESFKKNHVYNIQIDVDDSFKGTLKYDRWVKCKTCEGSGKDSSSKIIIRDNSGKVIKTFDGEDGCDFCEGTGKDYRDEKCSFCNGNGKVGLTDCLTCKGEKRILGKQKLNGVKLTGDETKIESMGHFSKDGKVGYLILKKVSKS